MKKNTKICVIEDDQSYRDFLKNLLKKYGRVYFSDSLQGFKNIAGQVELDIAFIDLHLGETMDGLQVIEIAKSKGIYPVVLSGSKGDETVEEAYLNGAQDYFVKGNENDDIIKIMEKFVATKGEEKIDVKSLTKNMFFGESLTFLYKSARNNIPVLMYGETGVGKSFLAKKMHDWSGRRGILVSLNCSSLPPELFESEMFGHIEGAFTGAKRNEKGKILLAHNGTLYLDEIDSMPLYQQAKLLQVIEEKEFYPVGSTHKVESDFRLICTSRVDLKDLVLKGTFREDLYYRISFLQVRIPPLRERREDIVPYLKMFLEGNRKYFFSQDFLNMINSHSFKGNIRELEIIASNIQANNKTRLTGDFLRKILEVDKRDYEFLTRNQIEYIFEHGLEETIQKIRHEVIKKYLEKNNGHVRATISDMGISSTSFYKWKEGE